MEEVGRIDVYGRAWDLTEGIFAITLSSFSRLILMR